MTKPTFKRLWKSITRTDPLNVGTATRLSSLSKWLVVQHQKVGTFCPNYFRKFKSDKIKVSFHAYFIKKNQSFTESCFATAYCVSSVVCKPSEPFMKRQTQIFIGLICLRIKSKCNSSHLQFVESKSGGGGGGRGGGGGVCFWAPPLAKDGATNWPLTLAKPICVYFCQILIAERDGYTNGLVCRPTCTTQPDFCYYYYLIFFKTHFINFKGRMQQLSSG